MGRCVFGVFLPELCCDPFHLRLGLRKIRFRSQPGKTGVAGVVARRHPGKVELKQRPQFGVPQSEGFARKSQSKTGGEDTDNLVWPTLDFQETTNHLRIGTESASPVAMAQDHQQRPP